VLGLIDPDYFLGGRIKLNRKLAVDVVSGIADRLGVSLEDTAYSIHTASNHNMVAAIEDITLREGINPRDSYFVCGGGATACHVAEMVNILGLKRYMIPRFTAGLSAFGGLISDLRWEGAATAYTIDQAFDVESVNKVLTRLRLDAEAFLDNARVASHLRRIEFAYMGRYEYQSWEIEVDFTPAADGVTAQMVQQLVESFHRMHERIYSIRNDADRVEFTTWRVRAIGKRVNQDSWTQFRLPAQRGIVSPKTRRPVYIHDGRSASTKPIPVYELSHLGANAEVSGPAILEAPTFSAFLRPGHNGLIDERGNTLVTVS
jgi:N-methylhydantoinase A